MTEKLTKAQRNVLKLIFEEKKSEEQALEAEKISIKVYERWFKQEAWSKEYETYMRRCQRRSEQLIQTYKELAAARLITLTECDKEETARRACLDIYGMEIKGAENLDDGKSRKLKPETAEAIMKIMAEENVN